MQSWTKNNDALGTVNRGVPCESGLCTLCMSNCKGKCETWLSSLVGRKILYPRNFGDSTSGSSNVTSVGLGYHALRIQGYAYGANGLSKGMTTNPDDCVFPNVDIETSFGKRGYLLDSTGHYPLWLTSKLNGTGSVCTACCARR